MRDPTCPKCNSDMEDGFIVDHTYGGVARPQWAEGEPVYSVWLGVRLKGKTQLAVKTYRCTKCGYLESYARS